jgi:hypothetical protein
MLLNRLNEAIQHNGLRLLSATASYNLYEVLTWEGAQAIEVINSNTRAGQHFAQNEETFNNNCLEDKPYQLCIFTKTDDDKAVVAMLYSREANSLYDLWLSNSLKIKVPFQLEHAEQGAAHYYTFNHLVSLWQHPNCLQGTPYEIIDGCIYNTTDNSLIAFCEAFDNRSTTISNTQDDLGNINISDICVKIKKTAFSRELWGRNRGQLKGKLVIPSSVIDVENNSMNFEDCQFELHFNHSEDQISELFKKNGKESNVFDWEVFETKFEDIEINSISYGSINEPTALQTLIDKINSFLEIDDENKFKLCFRYVIENNEVKIIKAKSQDTFEEIKIPSRVDDHIVTTIGSYIFLGVNSTLTKLTLPNSLKEISIGAFYNSKISQINYPRDLDLSSVKVGRDAFKDKNILNLHPESNENRFEKKLNTNNQVKQFTSLAQYIGSWYNTEYVTTIRFSKSSDLTN